jgi:hypothetical protein
MPLRYLFSFLSNMVYLSRASISASVGMADFHSSTAATVVPCRASAASTVATTVSTARRRSRCRLFWNLDSRHGIFHSRPPERGFVTRKGPNIVVVWCGGVEARLRLGSASARM